MAEALYLRLYWTLLGSFCALGISIALVQPLFSTPDEPMHWATGHVRVEQALGANGCVKSVVVERRKLFPPAKNTLSPLVCMPESDLYGDFLTYPGILLSKLIFPHQGESPLRQVQAIALTRLLQGLLVALCLLRAGVLAMRGPRMGMLVLGAFVMSPLLAQQAFAVSADGAQLAFAALLFCAAVFWERLSWIDVVMFAIVGWSAMAKPFMFTSLLTSVLSGFWFARLRRAGSATVSEVLADLAKELKPSRRPSVASAMLWVAILLSVGTVLLGLFGDRAHETRENAAMLASLQHDTDVKIAKLKADPTLLLSMVRSLPRNPWTLRNLVSPLGWLDVKMSRPVVTGFGRLLVVSLLLELAYVFWRRRAVERAAAASQQAKRMLLPLLIGTLGPLSNLLFVTLVVYILWSPANGDVAVGVQGRYFFGSTMAMLGVLFAAAQTVYGEPSEQLSRAGTQGNTRTERVAMVAAPTILLVLVLPYLVRIYVDLVSWYHY